LASVRIITRRNSVQIGDTGSVGDPEEITRKAYLQSVISQIEVDYDKVGIIVSTMPSSIVR
jgi:hypothetical protein